MKKITLIAGALFLTVASIASADNACIPAEAVICKINSYVAYNSGRPIYELTTTLQTVDAIDVSRRDAPTKIDFEKAKAALSRLKADAENLKASGVCKAIINNIE